MRYKILEILRENQDYVSGQSLAERLNVTRTAIWKNILRLKAEGYNISSVSNKGYLFSDTEDVLNSYEIEHNIRCEKIEFKCVFRDKVGSTNDLAKEFAADNCREGLIVTCNNQVAGKGRLGRQWVGADKAAVYMSVVLRPEISPMEAPQLTLITGISVCEAIRELTDLEAFIKWPNDIIINRKKASGILTEMSAEMESVAYVVIGIGVNLNQESFPEEISHKATSIFIECKKKYRRNAMICCIINKLEKNYNIFCKKGFSPLRQCYVDNCINIGKNVRAIKNNVVLEGVASDVNDNGELVIKTKDDKLINIASGEVSLRTENNNYI